MKTFASRAAPVLFALTFSTGAFAAAGTNPNLTVPGKVQEGSETPEHDTKTANEKRWVLGAEGGLGNTNYSGPLKRDISGYTLGANSTHTGTVGFDFYFAWVLANRHTIIGPVISTQIDGYNSTYVSDLSVLNLFVGATVQHYFDELKHGAFARVDLGFVDVETSGDASGTYNHDYGGYGFRAGFGYSIRAGDKCGVPILLQWQYASLRDLAEASSLMLTAGFTY